ncbi:HIT family protein [Longibacter sp.]|uniref:HIT family protein n=1 Tax=Longibacter sp. TaxID=2045415 RepID=UPI003EBFC379
MSPQDCSFCNIVSDGLPPHGLFETDNSFVVLDRKPLSFGHCMVVPKRHVVKLYELTPHEHANVLALAQRFALGLHRSLGCRSVAYLAFGSGLPHAHLHLVPHDDPNTVLEPLKHVRTRTDEQLERDADRLRGLLSDGWHQGES